MMTKTISAALIVTFALAPITLTSAQRSLATDQRALSPERAMARQVPERVQFGPARVIADRNGALIEWEMASEPGVIGYFVYLVDAMGPRLVNRSMALGAAARAGASEQGGERYQVFDPHGGRGSVYVIKGHGIKGEINFSKQIQARYVRDIEEFSGVSVGKLRSETSKKGRILESSALMLPEELQAVASPDAEASDLAAHRWVVSQPSTMISIKKDGLYRVSRDELAAAGFPVGSNPANWRLFLQGVEQPIIIGDGGQYIEFFGRGIDTPESDTRMYYMISGTTPGLRMASRILRNGPGNVVSGSFPMAVERRERINYINSIFNGDEENYWGSIVAAPISAPPVEVLFSLLEFDNNVDTARIDLKMQGFSLTPHQTRVTLNGHDLGIISGTGHTPYSAEFVVPAGHLTDGVNVLALSSVETSDLSLFDSVTVEYARKYIADNDRLRFFTPGFRRVNVDGFSSGNIRVFDTTQTGQPHQISNVQITNDGGSFSARIPSARPAVYYAVEDSAVLTPFAVAENQPSTLSDPSNGADLVIISHSAADFMTPAESWADYRRGQGFTVKVVDIRDVFDEFSYGVHAASAIKSFLNHAYDNWQDRPEYVLLIGDASYDPRNYEMRSQSWDLLPTKMIATFFEETGSDEALADFDGDGLSELAIGRIPARTAANITVALNKTIAFEAEADRVSRGALFVYGPPDPNNFQFISDTLREQLPPSVPATFLEAGAAKHNELIANLNSGKFITNYAGHGTTGAWSPTAFFSNSHVSLLTNSDKQTIFTMLTCLNGYFIQPANDSLSENLLKSQTGGAVAAWASSGKTTSDFQLVMGTRFYDRVADGDITRMGDLIKDAKSVLVAGTDVKFSWVLLGDPMLKVR